MSDAQLMEKYDLSAKGLESAFTKLVNSRIMSVEEIYGHPSRSGHDTVVVDDLRQLPRHFLSISIPVYDASQPNHMGKLRDITEKGLGIVGIKARIGEVKSFMIPCRKVLDIDNVWFEAECVWAEPGKQVEEWQGGFQITKISPEHLASLRDPIKWLALG